MAQTQLLGDKAVSIALLVLTLLSGVAIGYVAAAPETVDSSEQTIESQAIHPPAEIENVSVEDRSLHVRVTDGVEWISVTSTDYGEHTFNSKPRPAGGPVATFPLNWSEMGMHDCGYNVDGPTEISVTDQSGDVADTVTLSVSNKTDVCEKEGDSRGA
ncbi:hypothetical protein [Halostagnicola kamekurae]|uniref:hypothetical protein n=1 Tax=Halostagnicola kamekurae TaxID=619731 RepID=UPI0011136B43|nr:hypothetical protein [Halostagnicola kamekurae]